MRRPPLAFWILAIVAAWLALRPLPSGDLWWHLNVGEFLLDHGALPLHDPFSWTAAGERWTPHAPLFDGLLAWIYRLAGLDGLRLLRGLAPALAGLALLFLLRARLPGRATHATLLMAAALLPTALLMHRLRPFWIPLTMVPLAWWWIERALAGERPSRLAWFLGAWIWAGLHGSVVLAVAMPLAALVLDGREAPARRDLLLAAGLAFVASLLLPTCGELWLYAARLGVEDYNKGLVSEWQAPGFLGVHSSVQLTLLGLWALALAGRGRGTRRWEWLWALVWTLGYTQHMRQLGLALVAVAPLAARGLAACTGGEGAARPEEPEAGAGPWVLGGGALALALLASGALRLPGPALHPGFMGPEVEAWLLEEAPERLFHQFDWGGFVPWRTDGRVKAYVDGRIFLHGEQRIRDYLAIIEGQEGWPEALARDPIEAILLPAGHACLDRILAHGGWVEVDAPHPGVRLLVPAPGKGRGRGTRLRGA